MAKKTKFSAENLTLGQLNSVVETLMRATNTKDPVKLVELILGGHFDIKVRDLICVNKGGFSYLTFTADSENGLDWKSKLIEKKITLDLSTLYHISSDSFTPNQFDKYSLAILDGELFSKTNGKVDGVVNLATRSGLKLSTFEIGIILADRLSTEKISIRQPATIVVMHEPISDKNEQPSLLAIQVNKSISLELLPSDTYFKNLKNVYYLFDASITSSKKR